MRFPRFAALFVSLLAFLATVSVPLMSHAEISVVEPAGSASPELLEKIHRWLTGIADRASAETDAVMRIGVDIDGESVVLKLELEPTDGSPIIREEKVTDIDGATPRARSMARSAIRRLEDRERGIPPAKEASGPEPAAPENLVSDESAAEGEDGSLAPAEPGGPFDEKLALRRSLGTTFIGMGAGALVLVLGLAIPNDVVRSVMILSGASIYGLAYAIGPSLGHFYARNTTQAVVNLVLRTITTGGAPLFFGLAVMAGWFRGFSLGMESEQDTGEDDTSPGPGVFIALGAISVVAATVLGTIDLVTIPKAVRRANERSREGSDGAAVSDLMVSPVLIPGPRGERVAGLGLSMSF